MRCDVCGTLSEAESAVEQCDVTSGLPTATYLDRILTQSWPTASAWSVTEINVNLASA